MLCKIAEIITEIPEEGGIAPLLEEYKCASEIPAQITVCSENYRYHKWPSLSKDAVAYIEAGGWFNYRLLHFGGMMLHASAVELGGRAYLFSGPCGMGKSTHTRLWQKEFSDARIFNDDKPALRRIDGRWFAYGTPWSGKNHININIKAPLAGICFLKRGTENSIRRLPAPEAVKRLIHQTMRLFNEESDLDLMLGCVERLATEIPIFELHSLPEPAAAHLSHDTMLKCAEDLNL